MQLNEKQKEAVFAPDGPTLVAAGAGAGKTRVLTERILNLIKTGKAEPHEILAITFTNKAAKEMRERVFTRMQNEASLNRPVSLYESKQLPFVSTFHSLGVHIMREQARTLNIKRHFNILDRQDSLRLIKQSMSQMGIDPKEEDSKTYLNAISRAKSDALNPELYLAQANSFKQERIANIWHLYEAAKKKEEAFDFDDLLIVPLRLLQENDEILRHYQNLWKYILVDEYQDTNKVQFELLRLLADAHKNIFVVGDIDQAIYAWRGASYENMLLFKEHFPGAREIFLEQNYRSTKTIISAANAVIEKNKNRQEKTLFTEGPEGEKISLLVSLNAKREAEKVASLAKQLIERGIEANEIAVLYRVNFVSRVFEEAFLKLAVPYHILGTRFFDRKEVKDLISFLRLAFNRNSLVDLHRAASAVPRGLGKQTLLKVQENKIHELGAAAQAKLKSFFDLLDDLQAFALKNKLSDTLKYAIDKTGIKSQLEKRGDDGQERLMNLYELVELSKKYDELEPEEAVLKFFEESALAQDQDELEDKKDGVKLMTVHASKGLEFKVVFIVAAEQGIFPVDRFSEDDDEEEERRLFYVAITRAKEKLFISRALERQIYGESHLSEPSEFIFDIPEDLLESEVDYESDNQEKEINRGHDRGIDLIEW